MPKKIALLAGMVLLIALAGVGATLAYFTAATERTNVASIGNVRIDATVEQSGSSKIFPGVAFDDKKVTIRNTGSNDAYIRLRVEAPANLDSNLYTFSLKGVGAGKYKQSGGYVYLKDRLPKNSGPIELTSEITLSPYYESGQASADLRFKVYVEAIQTEHIGTGDDGFPLWLLDDGSAIEILEYS